ncbi:hypothetical protein SAMN05445756_0921 [Kytococcus aerolatus]|uniref:Uncharacterized protein n=1 Tax=Kytococcus aerolatus TaxID=592308 RepID=A0A212TCG8_9MICO|nr:hypothetical protein [Kytococcus aerolatus]SNC63514.1 hypothetical protein SAMN05445756_0921 [Kytococcus aerolatus]
MTSVDVFTPWLRPMKTSVFLLEQDDRTFHLLGSHAGLSAAGTVLRQAGIGWTPRMAPDLTRGRLQIEALELELGSDVDPVDVVVCVSTRVYHVFAYLGGYPYGVDGEPGWCFEPMTWTYGGARHLLTVDYGPGAGAWFLGPGRLVRKALAAAWEHEVPVLHMDMGSGADRDPACFAVPSGAADAVVQAVGRGVTVWSRQPVRG